MRRQMSLRHAFPLYASRRARSRNSGTLVELLNTDCREQAVTTVALFKDGGFSRMECDGRIERQAYSAFPERILFDLAGAGAEKKSIPRERRGTSTNRSQVVPPPSIIRGRPERAHPHERARGSFDIFRERVNYIGGCRRFQRSERGGSELAGRFL